MKCIFHKWSKWEQSQQEVISWPGILLRNHAGEKRIVIEIWQKRYCEKCNKMQMEKVAG